MWTKLWGGGATEETTMMMVETSDATGWMVEVGDTNTKQGGVGNVPLVRVDVTDKTRGPHRDF